jgi:hypothetical protein
VTTKTAAIATTLVAAIALTGCSSTGLPSVDPNLDGYASGDAITESQGCAALLDPSDGKVAYRMEDGTPVLLVLSEAIPAAVTDDWEQREVSELGTSVPGFDPAIANDFFVALVTATSGTCETPTIAPQPTDAPDGVSEGTTAGDAISEEQAREVNTDSSDGLRGYRMADGTYVLLRDGEPLPESVVADIEVKADAAVPAVSNDALQDGSNRTAIDGADRFANQLEREVGKNILMVFQIYGFEPNEDASAASLRWKIRNSVNATYPTINGETLDQAVARAEGIVAGFENPDEWVVIVVR